MTSNQCGVLFSDIDLRSFVYHNVHGHPEFAVLVLQKRILKVFTINEHGDQLGHVACTIYINFLSHLPRRLHTKFDFDWPSGFREDVR